MKKVRVALYGNLNRVAILDADATEGATIGKDLKGPNGNVLDMKGLAVALAAFLTVGAGNAGSSNNATLWRLVGEKPPNIVAIAELATTGFVVRLADSTMVTRAIATADASRIVVTNGDGIAGNPTLDLALVPNSGAGVLRAVTHDAYGRITGSVARTITGTAGNVTVTNGDAAAGNPTIDLTAVANSGLGALLAITRDSFGRVTGTRALQAGDVPLVALPSTVMLEGENVSLLNNDAGYLTAATVGAALPANVVLAGEGVAQLTNDAGYLTAATLPAGIAYLANNQTFTGSNTFQQTRGIIFRDPGATADNGRWDILTSGESFSLRALNDADTVGTIFLRVERTTTAIDSIALTAPAINTVGTLVTTASAAGAAGFRLPHGAAPSAPVNGDLWSTTTQVLFRLNGATVALYPQAGGGGDVFLANNNVFTGVTQTVQGTFPKWVATQPGASGVMMAADVSQAYVGTTTNHPLVFIVNNTPVGSVSTAGVWTFNGVAQTDFARLSLDNTFQHAGTVNQRIQSNDANHAIVSFYTANTSRGLAGAPGAANQLITGSAVGDLAIRAESGRVLISGDGGTTIHANIGAGGAAFAVGVFVTMPDSTYAMVVSGATNALRFVNTSTSAQIWARTASNGAYAPLDVAATQINLNAPVTLNGVSQTDFARLSQNNVFAALNQFGLLAAQSGSRLSNRGQTNANQFEWGHNNTAGYHGTLGVHPSSGRLFLGFHAEGGTSSDTYRTRGIPGFVIGSDTAGGIFMGRATGANADNQAVTTDLTISSGGSIQLNSTLNIITSASNVLVLAGAAPYISFYPTSIASRYGYFQHNGTSFILSNEVSSGTIAINTVGGSVDLSTPLAQVIGSNSTAMIRVTSAGAGTAGDVALNLNNSGNATWTWGIRRALGASLLLVNAGTVDGAAPVFSISTIGNIEMSASNVNGIIARDGTAKVLFIKGGTSGSQIVVSGSTHPTQPSYNYYDAQYHYFRDVAGNFYAYIEPGTGKLTVYSGRLNLRGIGVNPASPADGDMWYASGVGKFRVMAGGVVQDLN
jgi:hypothetical protein